LKGQITLSLEGVSSRMYRAASVELYGEPYRSLDELLALIDAISTEDVARVAQAFFDPDRLTVVSLGPKAAN
jgi:predicted Zn-dependent peptidase